MIDKYSMLTTLGKGAYAKVILVKNIDDGYYYAMKIVKKRKLKQKHVDYILTEKEILCNLDHQYLIKMKECFTN